MNDRIAQPIKQPLHSVTIPQFIISLLSLAITKEKNRAPIDEVKLHYYYRAGWRRGIYYNMIVDISIQAVRWPAMISDTSPFIIFFKEVDVHPQCSPSENANLVYFNLLGRNNGLKKYWVIQCKSDLG